MALSIERRMWVRLISNDALKSYMQFRGFRSVNELAMRIGVSKATIGHLHSGARRTCSPKTARLIEEALQAPPNSLFIPEVTPVTREKYQSPAAA